MTDEASTPSLSLQDILRIANTRKWVFLATFILIFVPAMIVVVLLPSQYRSSASILVESQQIPEDFVRSTITGVVDERIHFIQQKVLTRSNILEIVEKFDLYGDIKDEASATQLVDRFTTHTELEITSADIGNRKTATIAFDLVFYSPNPRQAQAVANELVTLYLNENVRTRSARAKETTEFLAEEGAKLKTQMLKIETQLSEFKQNNRATMPEVFEMNMALLERAERDYQTLLLDISGMQTQLRALDLQKAQLITVLGGSGATLGDLERRLSEFLIENQLEHPFAQRLLRQIEAAKAASADDTGIADSAPGLANINLQIETVKGKINLLEEGKDRLQAKLAELERRIADAPAVEQAYTDMQRDMDSLSANYEEIKDKELEARIAESLETERKGERFTLLEPPVVPDVPSKPNRPRFALVSVFAALSAALGLVVLLEMLKPGLRGLARFEASLGFPPLVGVPFVEIPSEVESQNTRFRLVAGGGLAAAAAVVVAVHFFLIPLDVLWFELTRSLAVG